MKGKRYLLIGLIFGMVFGWALGFLRLPHFEKNHSFLLGFTTAMTFVSFVILLLGIWNRNFRPGAFGQKSPTNRSYTQTFLRVSPLIILMVGGLVLGFTIYRQNASFKLQIQKKDQKLHELAALAGAVEKNALEPVMRGMLEDVGEELKRHPARTLGDTTIARIAALSFSLKPYKTIEGDSVSKKAYSPERGQLLQALVLLKIDTGSFARIKEKATFAGADLQDSELKGLDLRALCSREHF